MRPSRRVPQASAAAKALTCCVSIIHLTCRDKACPSGFEPTEDYLTCRKKNSVELLQDNFKQSKYIPFPYLIAGFVISISVIVAKFQIAQTFVPSSLLGSLAVIEVSSFRFSLSAVPSLSLSKLRSARPSLFRSCAQRGPVSFAALTSSPAGALAVRKLGDSGGSSVRELRPG